MEEKTNKTSDSFLTIADLWYLCITRWRWFVISIFICLLFAVRYLLTAPYLYTQSASVLVREEIIGNNATDKNSKEFNEIGLVKQNSNVTDVVRHITSLDVLVKVARTMNPSMSEDGIVSMAESIQDRLSAEIESKGSAIINLTYTDFSVTQAERVLYLIIQAYNDKWLADKQQITQNTSLFIDTRLKLLEQDLNTVDDSISAFKSRYGITSLENVSNIYLKQQSEADAEILKLMNQKAMAEYIRSLLEDEASQNQLLLVNSGINNSLIESQITLYNSMLLQMQSHMEYTSDQNPLIINLEKELNSLRKNILSNVINHIRTIDIQLQSLEDYHSLTTSKITSNPEQAKHLISIEREQKVKESLYLYLLQKKEENEINVTYRVPPTQILDIPHGSNKPTSPKRGKILLAAILLGGIMPLAFIFIIVTLDESVRNRFDIECRGDIPFLGEVPLSERDSMLTNLLRRFKLRPANNPIVVAEGNQSPVNEAFRILRTRLENINNGQTNQNVYMVTSSDEDAGKTFVAMNLALVLAIAEKRVLFIDGDLRKGMASRSWKASGSGLTDYLVGTLDDVKLAFFHPQGYPTLDVLPLGSITSNPTELLSGDLLGDMLRSISPEYDYVIIDAPSTGNLADAEIIEKHADCTLFVIRAGKFKVRNLRNLTEQEDKKKRYVVLNGVCINSLYSKA